MRIDFSQEGSNYSKIRVPVERNREISSRKHSKFEADKIKLREKEERRQKYSKYIYELNLPIELDRQELKRESDRQRLELKRNGNSSSVSSLLSGQKRSQIHQHPYINNQSPSPKSNQNPSSVGLSNSPIRQSQQTPIKV